MKKIKFVLPVASLLAMAGLVSCGGNSRDIKPQYNITFADCYVKDRTKATNDMVQSGNSVFPAWAYPDAGGGEEDPDVQKYSMIAGDNTYYISGDPQFEYKGGWTGYVNINNADAYHFADLGTASVINDNNEDIAKYPDAVTWVPQADLDTGLVKSAQLTISAQYCISDLKVVIQVLPDEKLFAAGGEKKPEPVPDDPTEEETIQGGIFGYVGSGDKENTGKYTITGNNTFQLGKDVDVTMTLDEFTYLNPIDGDLVETIDEDTGETIYSIENKKYFKIYVAESDTHLYDELKEELYEIKVDENDSSIIHFHIDGKYVKYSYKVFFSASYVNAQTFGFKGMSTIPYGQIHQGETAGSAFEKFVTNDCYDPINRRAGNDLRYIIYPEGLEGGVSFTEDYLKNLEFYGIKQNAETHKTELTNITDTVNTNLVHNYATVHTTQNDVVFGKYNSHVTYTTNQYACRVAIPWINSEHPELGIFKRNNDGTYTLNFDTIGVNVKPEAKKLDLPTYISKEEIKSKFTVSKDADTVEKATLDYYFDAGGVPTVSIAVEAKTDCSFDGMLSIVNSIKITSKTDAAGNKYFKDFEIDDSESIIQLLSDDGYYVTEDGCLYNFRNSYDFIADGEEVGAASTTKGTLYLHLPNILHNIALGPNSYGYLDPTSEKPEATYASASSFGDSSTSIDMIESFEIGVFMRNTGGK